MKFSVYQRTEKGSRDNNEDRMGYTYTRESALFVVADGLGGHTHGELASQIAVEAMTELFKQQAHPNLVDPADFLSRSFLIAHHQILQFSNEHGLNDTPRTTLLALVLQGGFAYWAHCGDTRLYWLRDKNLIKRTLDHSYIEQRPANLSISLQHLAKMTDRNVLFSCLGASSKPICDVSQKVPLKHGDKFFLCSDGLWGWVSDNEIVDALTSAPIVQAAPSLIDMALHRGRRDGDNVTVIGIEWEDSKSKSLQGGKIETDSLGNAVFASTIQNRLIDIDKLNFKDSDIERTLKEINDAIAKSNKKPT
jgi:PPM family protein phosphatase